MSIHSDRNRRRAEHFGLAEEAVEEPSLSNTKVELLAEAEARGVEVDESMTKKEILAALGEEK